jgi:hypothetical protein
VSNLGSLALLGGFSARFLDKSRGKKTLLADRSSGGLSTVNPRLLIINTACKDAGMRLFRGPIIMLKSVDFVLLMDDVLPWSL